MTEPGVRPPACADDRWYPSDPIELRYLVDKYLEEVDAAPLTGELFGLVSPHAGLRFAGPTAAHGYRQLQGIKFDRVILLGPSHFGDFGPVAANASAFYQTPLGDIEMDAVALRALEREVNLRLIRHDHEHSLEMQLPFLQRQLESFKLVPLMMSYPFYLVGSAALAVCKQLAAALASLVDDRTLLVASSDLSHLDDYSMVERNDARLAELFSGYDVEGLVDFMSREGVCRACGDMAIITLLLTARERGADSARILARTNSSNILGQHIPGQYTVGYMAAAVARQSQ